MALKRCAEKKTGSSPIFCKPGGNPLVPTDSVTNRTQFKPEGLHFDLQLRVKNAYNNKDKKNGDCAMILDIDGMKLNYKRR